MCREAHISLKQTGSDKSLVILDALFFNKIESLCSLSRYRRRTSSEYSIYSRICTDQVMNKTLQMFYTCSNTMLPLTLYTLHTTHLATKVKSSIELPLHRHPLRFIKALHVHICHGLLTSTKVESPAHTCTDPFKKDIIQCGFKYLPAVF